jgi:hypothetical protein
VELSEITTLSDRNGRLGKAVKKVRALAGGGSSGSASGGGCSSSSSTAGK